MKRKRIIILGAGPCGLGAAWRLKELGNTDFVVYEKEKHAGGLASSYTDVKGFVWDVGGHVVHSHYPYFDTVTDRVMERDWISHTRESWIWVFDQFIPYPFQYNFHRLPDKQREMCLAGLRSTKFKKVQPANFSEWIFSTFGKGIAQYFMLPYNRKQWSYPLEKMGYQWIADRVAPVDLMRIEHNIRKKQNDVTWGPNHIFRFPARGGTGEIWKRIAKFFPDHIILGRTATHIDSRRKIVTFDNGSYDRYDALFTSIPLDRLLTLVTPKHNMISASTLRYSSVAIIGLGVSGKPPLHMQAKNWIYFPQANVPFFRATVFSNYSTSNAPPGTWSLMTEVSSSDYRTLLKIPVTEAVINSVKNIGLIDRKSEIIDTWFYRVKYGYPIPTLHRDDYVSRVLAALEQIDVYSRGRFGAWKYEVSNMDHAFMQGVEWVNRMMLGDSELTVHNRHNEAS